MTAAREDILRRLRAANDGREATATALPERPIPARTRGTPAELVERFVAMARAAAASVARIQGWDAVPQAVADYLAAEGLGREATVARNTAPDYPDPWRASGLTVRRGRPRSDDGVGVTGAFAGIAETGSVMVHAGPAVANALHLLPETHIAVLASAAIVGGYEEAWAQLRAAHDPPPRAVTLITGPSRSSDIERVLQIGVHGPRRFHIVLVDGA